MRAVLRTIVGFIVALTVLACDDSVGLDGDVELVAEVRKADNLMVLTVENRSSDTIYYHKAWLERRNDGDWERFDPPFTDELPVHPIAPSEDFTYEREIVVDYAPLSPPPGEYRFRVNMSPDGNGISSSEDAAASNTFQIEP